MSLRDLWEEAGDLSRPVVGFDLDGTLVDLEAATRFALCAASKASSRPIDIDAIVADRETPCRQSLRRFVDADEFSKVTRVFSDAFTAGAARFARALPYAANVLAAVRSQGHDALLITGRTPAAARAVLAACGLPDLPVAGNVVGEQKAPVMAVHGVLAYIGDHPLDMLAARRADVYAVGLARTVRDARALRSAGADHILPDIGRFSPWYRCEGTQRSLAAIRPSPRGISRLPLSGGPGVETRGRPEYWAARHPDRAAVVDGDTVLTYQQWDERAEKVAEGLTRLCGVGRHRVAVRMHQRPEWFVVNLALAKLGWEHVAVSWRLTPAEVGRIVAECVPRALIVDDERTAPLTAALAEAPTPVFSLGGTDGGAMPFELLLSAPRVERESLQPAPIVLYSSGTTGTPRVARRTPPRDALARQQNLDDIARGQRGTHRGRNRTLLTLPLDHGAGPRAAQYCQDSGGCVYLLDRFDPVRALTLIERHRITHWKTVPTMISRLRNLEEPVLRRYDVSSLQAVSVGAAPFAPALKLWAAEFFGPGVLHEGYGSTEAGIVTAMPPSMIAEKPASCGKPREYVTIRVADAAGRELPHGSPGHILVRSPATARGGDRGSTAGVPCADGFLDTGDVGYVDDDGYLYVTGRSKDMVIVGGRNVYPAEVEHAIAELDAVLDAAVIGVPDADLGETVVAVCELRPGKRLTADEVGRHLESRLAPYKRPRRVEFVDELPRNQMQKVLKNQLRAVFCE